jgi:hypothetical protein
LRHLRASHDLLWADKGGTSFGRDRRSQQPPRGIDATRRPPDRCATRATGVARSCGDSGGSGPAGVALVVCATTPRLYSLPVVALGLESRHAHQFSAGEFARRHRAAGTPPYGLEIIRSLLAGGSRSEHGKLRRGSPLGVERRDVRSNRKPADLGLRMQKYASPGSHDVGGLTLPLSHPSDSARRRHLRTGPIFMGRANNPYGDVQQAPVVGTISVAYRPVNPCESATTCGGASRGHPSPARILRSALAFAEPGPARRIVA